MTTKEINLLHRDLYVRYGPHAVELITTHASWVFLTPEYAYKIKKPVQFSFLDYSTVEKREHALQEELRLNRRFTKDVYLEVVEISSKDNRYYLETAIGNRLDFALKMRRIDPLSQMDRQLDEGKVGPLHMKQLAEQIADFHNKAERRNHWLNLEALKEQFNDIKIIEDFILAHFGPQASKRIEESIRLSNQFLEEQFEYMLERETAGWVIDGHGDLHARNIFLVDPPILFDCIEFNEAFRVMDILNEIAFFCMDLHYFGRQDLVAHFMEYYLTLVPCIQNATDWMLFHYFKLYRANVRLKVNTLNAMQTETPEELNALLPTIQSYLELYTYYLRALH